MDDPVERLGLGVRFGDGALVVTEAESLSGVRMCHVRSTREAAFRVFVVGLSPCRPLDLGAWLRLTAWVVYAHCAGDFTGHGAAWTIRWPPKAQLRATWRVGLRPVGT